MHITPKEAARIAKRRPEDKSILILDSVTEAIRNRDFRVSVLLNQLDNKTYRCFNVEIRLPHPVLELDKETACDEFISLGWDTARITNKNVAFPTSGTHYVVELFTKSEEDEKE